MRARSLLFLLILALMMGGCSNAVHDDKKEVIIHKESSSSQTSSNPDKDNKVLQDDTSWKKAVAERLLQEFNDYYKKMQTGDNILFNKVMAEDRASGLFVYKEYISDRSRKDMIDKLDKIRKLSKTNGKIFSSTVLFGYTKSGLHIMVLMDTQDKGSMEYKAVCNLIRGYKQETTLFEDMYFNHRCYMSDIFIEDLSNKREKFEVNVDPTFGESHGVKSIQEIKSISDRTKEALKKYNRSIEPKDGVYSNKTWRLIAVEQIFHFLKVNVDGEKVRVDKYAADRAAENN